MSAGPPHHHQTASWTIVISVQRDASRRGEAATPPSSPSRTSSRSPGTGDEDRRSRSGRCREHAASQARAGEPAATKPMPARKACRAEMHDQRQRQRRCGWLRRRVRRDASPRPAQELAARGADGRPADGAPVQQEAQRDEELEGAGAGFGGDPEQRAGRQDVGKKGGACCRHDFPSALLQPIRGRTPSSCGGSARRPESAGPGAHISGGMEAAENGADAIRVGPAPPTLPPEYRPDQSQRPTIRRRVDVTGMSAAIAGDWISRPDEQSAER